MEDTPDHGPGHPLRAHGIAFVAAVGLNVGVITHADLVLRNAPGATQVRHTLFLVLVISVVTTL